VRTSHRWVQRDGRMCEINAHKMLVWKPERKGPFGRPRYRREDNIKLDLKEVECLDCVLLHRV
jgi:hypothetical protein